MESQIALIGYGEAGSTFAKAAGWGCETRVWDVLPERRAKAAQEGLKASESALDALRACDCALSLVTADQALSAACEYAAHLAPDAFWFDMNSVAPATKRVAADAVGAVGAHYVDIAVLAPVDPARLDVPLLLSGPRADRAEPMLRAAGFTNLRIVGDEVGRASAIKMIRSVMVKGIEALTDEMMAAAEAAGVAEDVLASLDASERGDSWARRAAYNRERMATHGLRRAAEMNEAASTLESLGVEPIMTRGTVSRQRDASRRKEPA